MRHPILAAVCCCVVLLLSACNRQPFFTGTSLPQLELVEQLRLDNAPRQHEPSGLVMVNGRLFTVCDKTNDTVFEIIFTADGARMVPHTTFTPPARGSMDWEGITVSADGRFCLISETHGRMFIVGDADWATPDLRGAGRSIGLFKRYNAHFEAITALDEGHFLGAAEREPRGLVEWQRSGNNWQTQAWLKEQSPFMGDLPLLRVPDYSGMDTSGERVFALFRGASLVVELVRTEEGWQEIAAWSYAAYERDPAWAYENQTYGQAEGLVVDGRDVYIVFDNNRGGRSSDPADTTSMLLHLRFPDATP